MCARSDLRQRPPWTALLVLTIAALGAALAPACNADVETICYGANCQGTGGGDDGTSTSGGGGGGGGSAMCSADPQQGDFPCDVHAILQAKCQTCHDAAHANGAPIDLLACSRFHEVTCGTTVPRLTTAKNYIASGFMPIGADLTEDESATLLAWLDACAPCAPEGETGCGEAPGDKACYEQ